MQLSVDEYLALRNVARQIRNRMRNICTLEPATQSFIEKKRCQKGTKITERKYSEGKKRRERN